MAVPQSLNAFTDLRDIGDILIEKFDGTFQGYQPFYPRWFDVLNPQRWTESTAGIVGPSQLQEINPGEDAAYEDVLAADKTTVTAKKMSRGLSFTREAIKFDMSKLLGRAADKLARAARYAAEVEAARILNEAITTNHAVTAVPLVSNSQPIKRTGGTFDNRIDGDLSVAVLDSALIQFANTVDQNGEFAPIKPKYLLHTPGDRRVARQLIISEKEPFTAENQANVFKNELEAVEYPFLSDADNAFVVAGPDDNGLRYGEWEGVRRRAWEDQGPEVLKFAVSLIMKAWFAVGDYPSYGVVGIIGA